MRKLFAVLICWYCGHTSTGECDLPWILWYTSQAWEQWPQHQIYHRYISSAHLDPPWDLSFEINVVLTGLNSKYLCTRGKWLTAVLRSSASSLPGMFSVWANELLMGQVCLAPGDRRETGDCPRHGHQWSRDTWWWLLTWTQCYQALCIVLSQLHWVWWPLISQITANNDAAPHIMVNSESPFRRLKLR